MTNSRKKGATFERAIAKELLALTGISFKRNLDQYQERGQGDLTPSDPDFPFVMECKAYASGGDCLSAWEAQAFTAASGTGKHPVVIYKFNNRPVRVRIWFDALAEAFGASDVSGGKADISLQDFGYVASEIMSFRAMRKARKAQDHIDLSGEIG